MEKKVVLGIDLGGTNIKGLLVSANGQIIGRDELKSDVTKGIAAVEEKILQLATQLVRKKPENCELIGVGLCTPGVVDPKTGIVKENSPNIPGLINYPLAQNIAKIMRLPVLNMNDAKAAALGEAIYGAGRGSRFVCFLGLGTGVGGGVVIDGKPYLGYNNSAGELGHICVENGGLQCRCGQKGCLEAYAGTEAFLNYWDFLYREAKIETQYFPKNGKGKIFDIFSRAKQGDSLCLKVVKETCHYLARGIAQILTQWNPEVFVIGGQISRDGDFFLPFIREEINQKLGTSRPCLLKGFEIVAGKFPAEAGCLGAARNALEKNCLTNIN
ncbi:MAG: ROK family protein [Patescibacteria group bacterium]|nr:ROK family protein [Patescibacteria group bacterium]